VTFTALSAFVTPTVTADEVIATSEASGAHPDIAFDLYQPRSTPGATEYLG